MVRPKYEVETSSNIRVPVDAEGTCLAADLYRPRTSEQVPGIVTFHYGRRTLGIRCFRYFAEAGYASLVVDCRGIGESDGLARPPLDPREGQDGAAIIAWLASQPWCTGSIGMWGFSGGAALTLLTASQQPPELKAIFPIQGFTSWERDLVHPGGLQGGIGFYMLPCIEKMLNDFLPPMRGENLQIRRKVWREKIDAMDQWIADAWRLPPGEDEWRRRDIDVSSITAACCCVGGWFDLCRESVLSTYEKISAPKKLIVGPWLHDLPENAALEPMESLALAVDWWDQWLSPAVNVTHEESAHIYIQGSERWTRSETWPPWSARTVTFATTSSMNLVLAEEPQDATRTITQAEPDLEPVKLASDPTVGLLSGLWTMPIKDIGYPLDQHDDDQRSMSFTTEALSRPMTIIGCATVTLAVSQEMSARRCVVKLADVDENGRSTVITNGLSDLSEMLSKKSSPDEDEKHCSVSIVLDPSCYTVARGHRLRLVLSDSDFPRLWPADSREVLGINVVRADACDRPRVGSGVTTIAVPTTAADNLPFADRPFPAPVQDRGSLEFSQLPTWRISRDHPREGVRLELSTNQRRLYTPDGARIRERNVTAMARVSKDDPADASMSVKASFHIGEAADEEVIVRVGITIDGSGGVASGEVLVDDEVIAAREWSR